MANGVGRATDTRSRLSLVIPAYNEEAGIEQMLAETHETLTGLDYHFEIIVVDDGSSDGTADLVEDLSVTMPTIRLYRHPINQGYGAALRTGFEAARYDLIAFTDADGQFVLEDLDRLIAMTEDYPIVVGYRVNRQDSWRRRFFSWGYNRLVRTLLGTRVRDCDCALKVFRRDVLEYLFPVSKDFFVNAEMLCRANRLKIPIMEIGVRHLPRVHGQSKVSLWDIPRTFKKLLPFWWNEVLWADRPEPLRLETPVLLPPFRWSRSKQRHRPSQPR